MPSAVNLQGIVGEFHVVWRLESGHHGRNVHKADIHSDFPCGFHSGTTTKQIN